MKRNIFTAGTASVLIIFTFAMVLCPIAIEAKKNRTAPKEKSRVEKNEDGKDKTEADKADTVDKDADKKAKKKENEGDLPLRDYKEEDFAPKVEEESYAWMVVKTILVLGLLIGGFYYFFRFVTKKAGIELLGGEAIKVLAVVPIGQSKYLQLIDLAGKILVIGVTDNSINLISEVTEKEEIDRLRILSSKGPAVQAGGFQEYLAAQFGRVVDRVSELKGRGKSVQTGRTVQPDHMEQGIDLKYLKEQKNRLKKLNGDDDE